MAKMKKPKNQQEKDKETTKSSLANLLKEIAKSEGILSAVGDGISILDRTFKILYQNQVHKDMMGVHVGEFCYKAYAKRQGICGGCPVALTFKDGKAHTVQRELQTYKGYAEITASPLKDPEGKIIAGVEVVRDITERKNIQDEILKIKERLNFILNTAPVALYTSKASGDYGATFISGSIQGLLGYKPDDFTSNASFWADNIHPNDRERVFQELPNILKHGYHIHGYRFRHADGTYHWMHDESKLIYDNNGTPLEIIGCWIDITERKKTEDALKEREKELQIEARNLEEANVALKVLLKRRDEDKTELEDKVLLNIKGLVTPYLEKLKMSGLDKSQKAYVTILESSLNQMTSPFLHRLSFSFSNFTPTEIQVANLLKQGKTNKEIGELLNSSSRTIAFHRDNIRKKLGLKNKKTNLKSYLLSLK